MAKNTLFFYEDTHFKLRHLTILRSWLCQVAKNESYHIEGLNYIFCSDEYLYKINKSYLDHHDYTDIITFDNSEEKSVVIGDVFISIERATENASDLDLALTHEVHRLLIHGILHLLGYKDKTKKDKSLMTVKEDYYLSLLTEYLN